MCVPAERLKLGLEPASYVHDLDWVSRHSADEPESMRTVNASADELGAFTHPAIM